MTARSLEGWPRWLAALLMGLLLILALLIVSWFLRACAPVAPSSQPVHARDAGSSGAGGTPDPTPILKASLDDAEADGKKLSAELAALEADIRKKVAQCKPIEPPKPVEPPKPPRGRQGAAATAAIAGRPLGAEGSRHAAGLLAARPGHARQHRLGGRSERCAVKAGRICFGANGGGERRSTAVCPATGTITCAAPITARFGNDNTLGTTQPAVQCSPGQANWTGPPNSLTCRRVSDTLAVCRDRLNFEYEFRRE